MRMKTAFFALAVVSLLVSPALADLITIHSSTENYFSTGGTNVLDDKGQFLMSKGDVSGQIWWEVKEKAIYDTVADKTYISYTVFNDLFAAAPITSFYAPTITAPSLLLGISAPAGWNSQIVAGGVHWFTQNLAFAIGTSGQVPVPYPYQSLDTMILTYAGRQTIYLAPWAAVDLTDPLTGQVTVLTSQDWLVTSVVPVPGAALLVGIGLSLVAWFRRRMA